ncbi:UTRA domain-containing protein, partial [Streptomyces sp. ME02-8801-2C]|uniref:UTRA domain-containing protein n=1 Tax=Streptomyces sp. ME02-8801-2C TaxID=3028680 RepID=UPI0029BC75CE
MRGRCRGSGSGRGSSCWAVRRTRSSRRCGSSRTGPSPPAAAAGAHRPLHTAPSHVAELLGIATADQTVIRARHMYDGERLVQLADSYVPVDVADAAGIENPDPGLGGIISRMRDAGFEQTEAIEEITLYAATSVESDAFGVEIGSNLLQITHTGYTKTGRAVEVTVHRPRRLMKILGFWSCRVSGRARLVMWRWVSGSARW